MRDFVYDEEVYPNFFSLAAEEDVSGLCWYFEISEWRNDSRELIDWVNWLAERRARMVGFNSLGFDYPILHMLYRMGRADAASLYAKAQSIITSQDDDRWSHQVYQSDRIVEQIDLFRTWHFDNRAKWTSLKALQFNMRSDQLVDLPFPVGTVLTYDQAQIVKAYNHHDVSETKRFYRQSLDMIRFREELAARHPDQDWLNFNDTKIGKQYFIMKLEAANVQCYSYGKDGRQPRQTKRPSIALRDAILPWISFERPEFQRVLDYLKQQVITETKGVFDDLSVVVEGLEYVFGLGGIHGSVDRLHVESTDQIMILDIDVEAYYPSTAIAQNFRPAHYPEIFSVIYADLKTQRKSFKKGTSENSMLKLAINGVFGDSNNKFSVFYDPLMTMSITLNGQLLMCLLAEKLLAVPGLKVVQANTDGLSVMLPRANVEHFRAIVKWWEQLTKLDMEENEYRRMIIRDVNNYIAEYANGKVKRKGAYEHVRQWHQDASALVIPKVAEQALLHGAPIRKTVEAWPDRLDFMMRVKVPRSSYLSVEFEGQQHQQQNTCRYYVAKTGATMWKWMPPLKGKPDWRKIGIESGWNVQVCNDLAHATASIEFDYYVKEVEKLCLGIA